jgi:hypothetical protein
MITSTIFYYKDNLTKLDFLFLKNKGYNTQEIYWLDFSFLSKLKKNDLLFIDIYYYDKIKENLPTHFIFTIILYRSHEYIPIETRKRYLLDKHINHIIFFITTHLDTETIDYDLSIHTKCYSFGSVLPSDMFKHPTNRNKKFNFYNRAVNLRRLKVFELIKKRGIKLDNCYYTFMGKIIKNDFMNTPEMKNNILYRRYTNVDTLKEFYLQKTRGDYEIDIDFIESFKDEFIVHKDSGYMQIEEMFPILNESLDSYISFIIESSDDSGMDLRITEKLFRAFLSKNIFLVLQCNKLTTALNNHNIYTFDDVFGLEKGWDNTKSEIERIELFTDTIEKINNKSLDDIQTIYNRKDIQERLEFNYQFALKAINDEHICNEIESKLLLLNNKVFI